MYSCSQESVFSNLDCESTELQFFSGTVIDFYTDEPIADANIALLDFTSDNGSLLIEKSDESGKFEIQGNICVDTLNAINRFAITHENYQGSFIINPDEKTELVAKMYRTVDLKVNLIESDLSVVDDIKIQFRHYIDGVPISNAIGTNSESRSSVDFKLPESMDIEFSHIINEVESAVQILNLSGDDELDINYE